jgi:two-component system, NtrC family, nitrogen regulation sensor histidine kinase NtrY
MMRSSLAARVVTATVLVAAVTAGLSSALVRWTASAPLAALTSIVIAVPMAFWAARLATHTWSQVIRAVRDGVLSLRDHDFSISIAPVPGGELRELVTAYNSLGDLLRRERLDLYQRELLLDTVIQTTPLVMVLTNSVERIVYSNVAARQLFHGGRKLEGLDFPNLLADSPAALREALTATGDTLFTMEVAGEPHVYHLSQRRFHLNAQPHRLVLLKQLTRELAAQEVAVWKKVIRVIAHELNNSLAPISSLVHSGRLLARELPGESPLDRVFATIGERTTHLTAFIDGYARFAKLPRPRPTAVGWPEFLVRLEGTTRFRVTGELPRAPASFDVSQLEQVMINLLKNAAESGSAQDEITVTVRESHTAGGQGPGVLIEVADRGSGLADEVLRDALLPFYSTKPTGTGLGLTLCREIVEAHGGRLSIANRPDGGALVSVWLPSERMAQAAPTP